MKRTLLYITILALVGTMPVFTQEMPLDLNVPILRAQVYEEAEAEVIGAHAKGQALLIDSYFRDLGDSPYKEEVTRLAALGVVEKYGSFDYRPSEALTGFETLALLVRMTGGGDVVNQQVLAQAQNMNAEALKRLYDNTYLEEALNRGILLEEESGGLFAPVTRERFAVWLGRTLGLAPTPGDLSTLMAFEDWDQVDPSNRQLIEPVLAEKILMGENDGRLNPRGQLTRGEAALTLARGLPYASDGLGIEEGIGMVVSVEITTEAQAGGDRIIHELTLKELDGTYTTLGSVEDRAARTESNYVGYRKGVISGKSVFKVGDQVAYYTLDDQVRYVRSLEDQAVLRQLITEADLEGTRAYYAEVKDTFENTYIKDSNRMRDETVRVVANSGDVFDIVVTEDLYTGIKEEIPVFLPEGVGEISDLVPGDTIMMIVTGDQEVVYLEKQPLTQERVKGTLRSLDEGEQTLTIYTYDNEIKTYPYLSYTQTMINGRPTAMGDLKFGQDIELLVKNGTITQVYGETFLNPGYIPAYGKMRMGDVYTLNNDGLWLTLSTGEKMLVSLAGDPEIVKAGRAIAASAIRMGDKVKVYYDAIDTNRPSRIEVEGKERIIKNVYRGRIANVNLATGSLVLEEPYTLANTRFEKMDTHTVTIKMHDDGRVYHGDRYLALDELLRGYRGDVIYVVVEDFYGNERGMQATIKKGGEQVFSDSIDDLNQALSRVELDSKQNVAYSEGTIVLKNGRLIAPENLKYNDHLLVVSDYYRGTNHANVLQVTGLFDDYFRNVRFGTIDQVAANYFTLDHVADIDGFEFNTTREEREMLYTFTETQIIDATELPPTELDQKTFFNEPYSRTENRSTDDEGLTYERYYAVIVTDGEGGTVAMKLRHKGLDYQQNLDDNLEDRDEIPEAIDETLASYRITRGLLSEKDENWSRFTLTDAYEWSRVGGEWRAQTNDVTIEHSEALFIREGEVIEEREIEVGDELMFLRSLEDAVLIFVEAD